MQLRTRMRLGGAGLAAVAAGLLALPVDAAAQVRLAFVDQQRAVISSSEGQEANKTLQALQQRKQTEIKPQQDELQRLREEFEAQRFVLSQEALEERRLEIVKRERDLGREIQQAREEIEIEQRKILAPLIKRIESTIQEIGRDRKFDLILDRSSPGVLYYQDAHDITDLVIERLNKN